MSSLVWLSDPDFPGMDSYRRAMERATTALKLRLTYMGVRSGADLDVALARMEHDRPDAMGVVPTTALFLQVGRIIEFAARHTVPTLYSISSPLCQGGLMSYGQDFDAIHGRVAWMIDKILKGAKPNDIPVEEPARSRFIINMKTAKAMGLTIPPIVLLQAAELIE